MIGVPDYIAKISKCNYTFGYITSFSQKFCNILEVPEAQFDSS